MVAAGPGRLLGSIYALFALAAGARSGVQITTKFGDAPLAYILSAFAAVVYLVAAISFGRASRRAWQVATTAVGIELMGVLIVGTASLAAKASFPDQTVWSNYGSGYGFIPLVLPIVGLWWLLKHRPDAHPDLSASVPPTGEL